MQFNEQSKAAFAKIVRTKLKEQMGEHAYRIDAFSDDKIIYMDRKWRERTMEKFSDKWRESRRNRAGEDEDL
jgi:tRNA A37 threonylcarbamoyladenosine dehydratase